MASKKQQKVITRKISTLKEHPRQKELVGDVPEAQLAALTDRMKAHGLQHAIEILPCGMVIAGHQRLKAAKRLGWKTIDVIVRGDLAEAGAREIEAYLVGDNLYRRQLSPRATARAIQFLAEHRHGVSAGGLMWEKKEELLIEIGRRLDMSARNVSRYLLVAQTPDAVQAAFDRGEIGLTLAGRVAMLDGDIQETIAQRIDDGENAAKVVAEFVVNKFKNRRGIDAPFLRLVRALNRDVPLVVDSVEDINPDKLIANLPALRDAASALKKLIEEAQRGAA